MHFWQMITQMGVYHAMPLPLQDRIRFANRMGLFMALVGFSLTIVYLSLGRNNTHTLIILGLFGLAVPFLNALGANLFTRILISIAPAITTTIFDLSLKINKPLSVEIISYITPRYVVLSSMMIPLILFVYKERWLRNFIILLLLLLVFNFDTLFYLTGTHFTQIRTDLSSKAYAVQWINIVVVMIILLVTTSFLLYTNKKNEENNQQILLETQATNARLQESEKKLKEMLETLQQSKQELEKQSWVSMGLAHFLQVLRQEKDFDRLCQILLSDLVTYIQAQQGALYWLNQENPANIVLELRATYALSVGKAQKTSILPDEGLIGAVFSRQQPMHLKQIHENYSNILSGLGEGKPQEILILPLIYGEKSIGIIELATFYAFEEYHIDLMRQVSEAIATTLTNLELSKRSGEMLNELQKFKSKISYL